MIFHWNTLWCCSVCVKSQVWSLNAMQFRSRLNRNWTSKQWKVIIECKVVLTCWLYNGKLFMIFAIYNNVVASNCMCLWMVDSLESISFNEKGIQHIYTAIFQVFLFAEIEDVIEIGGKDGFEWIWNNYRPLLPRLLQQTICRKLLVSSFYQFRLESIVRGVFLIRNIILSNGLKMSVAPLSGILCIRNRNMMWTSYFETNDKYLPSKIVVLRIYGKWFCALKSRTYCCHAFLPLQIIHSIHGFVFSNLIWQLARILCRA